MVSLLVLTVLAISTVTQVQACNPWDDDIKGLRHRVDAIEEYLENLNINGDCQEDIAELQTQINDLQTQIDILQTQMDDLQNQVDELTTDYNSILIQIDARITVLEQQYQNVVQLYETIIEIQNDITEIKTTITNMNVTNVTIINRYYETYNYGSAITTINNYITDINNHLATIDATTIMREDILNHTIIELQKAFNTLETKVNFNNENILKNFVAFRSEFMTQIQSIDLKHTNTENNLQQQITDLKKDMNTGDTFLVTKIGDLTTRVSNLEAVLLNQMLLILVLLLTLVITTMYFFFKTRKLDKLVLPPTTP
jgi:chromosome segregation ATPase